MAFQAIADLHGQGFAPALAVDLDQLVETGMLAWSSNISEVCALFSGCQPSRRAILESSQTNSGITAGNYLCGKRQFWA